LYRDRWRAGSYSPNAASNARPDFLKSTPLVNCARLRGAVLAVHAAVFPFDRQRAVVADVVERADDLLEVHAAVAQRAEVPAAVGVPEVQVRAQYAGTAVERAASFMWTW
jgi:hypothetical protein